MMSAVGTGHRHASIAPFLRAADARGVDPGRRAGRAQRPARVRGALVRAHRADRRGRGDRRGVGASVGSRSTASCSATAPTRPGAGRSRASRRASSWSGCSAGCWPSSSRRRPAGASSSSRSCCCSPGLSYVGAVRRPAHDVHREPPASPIVGTARPVRTGRRGAKIALRPGIRPSRTGGCRSRSDRSPTTSCRRMLEVDRRGFGAPPRPPDRADSWVRAELDRTRCAFERGAMVGCSRAYSFELTMPGGALRARRRRVVGRGAADAPPARCAHRDDGRAARRRAVDAARSRSTLDRVGEHHLRAVRLRRRPRGGSAARSSARLRAFARPVADPGSRAPRAARRGRRRSTETSTSGCAPAGRAWSRGPTPGGPRCSG